MNGTLIFPAGFSWDGTVHMGALYAVMNGFTPPPVNITINPAVMSNYEFDNSAETPPGKFDFISTMVHEVGHALGFYSQLEDIDGSYPTGSSDGITPSIF